MTAPKTRAELEAEIISKTGIRPGNGNPNAFYVEVASVTTNVNLFVDWLVSCGVDPALAKAQTIRVLRNAYHGGDNYIRKIGQDNGDNTRYTDSNRYGKRSESGSGGGFFNRNRTRPPLRLDLDETAQDAMKDAAQQTWAEHFDKVHPTTAASTTTTPDLNDLLSRIGQAAEQVITPKLAQAKNELITVAKNSAVEAATAAVESLGLAESTKAAIRKLATDAAKAAIDANLPRTVEIRNLDTGTTKNIGLQHERFDILLRAANARLPSGFRPNIWLTGPTGSGKTTAVENVAKALGLEFSSDGSLDNDYKVSGFMNAAGQFVSTKFLVIFENGGIYCADEIDNWLPSALLSLNSALANGWAPTPERLIKRHKDFVCIACANTWGLGATNDYVGRSRLDAATLDRFHPKIEWPVDEKLERQIAMQHGEMGTAWVETVQSARREAKTQGLQIIISPRSTFAGIALQQQGFSIDEAVEMTFGAGLTKEQRSTIVRRPREERVYAA